MTIQQQQSDLERREQEEAAWEAHLAYLRTLYQSPARGYGSGHSYEYHGPYLMGADGKLTQEQRLK